MTAFTRLGSSIWDWEPWTELEAMPRLLWLAMYTSAEAKRHVPGLWHGGLPSMADAARMKPDDVIYALDTLLERDLVEYDPKFRVLRLCELPDCGEYPNNGKVILGWWTRFQTVPTCPVRDAHVRTLEWICTEGAKRSGKTFTPHHMEAWQGTFARIAIPAPRKRGVRRLADSDTGTQVQPSLFAPLAGAVPLGSGIAPQGESSYPQVSCLPVDNSAALHQPNKIRAPETVSDTVSDTNRIPDPGSRIPDLSSLSGEGGWGGGHESGRPVLTLVPPYAVADVLRELAAGPWDPASDRTHQNAIGALISTWVAQGWGVAEFALLAEYNRHAGRRWNARALVGCDLRAELETARRTLDWREAQVAMMRGAP